MATTKTTTTTVLEIDGIAPLRVDLLNATPSSSESIKIDEEKLDRYVGSIIAAAASSLQDVVIRVSSSTRQSEKDSDNGVASSLNVCGILTLSYSEVTPSESLTAVCEPEGGTPVHAFIQEVTVQESSDPPVDQPPQSPSTLEPSGKKIKSGRFKWPRKSSAVRPTNEDTEKVPVQESSDPPVDQPLQSPSSPEPSGKKSKSRWFKRPRKSSAVRPTTEDTEKDSQVGVHRIAFEESHCDEYVGSFFTKSDHCDESGNDVFLLNTGKVPLVSKLFRRSESKTLAENLCSNVEEFVLKNLVTDKFTVIIHGEDNGAKLCSLHLAKKFYKLLKTRFFEGLNFCIILKAKFTLKAVFKLAKPIHPTMEVCVFKNNVKQKISMVNDVDELVFHGIPDTVLRYTC
ncbi:uncharacterized protein [Pocillopora verrucosa]|uniref:uncharacterized protein n=1 Tax=Pocillopora verrucosa TaxID=203993 RepID=UPI0033424A6A